MNEVILILTLLASVISVFLQFQNSKLRKLEEENKSHKINLIKALKSIQGYQDFVNEISNEKGKTPESLKAEIHSKYKESFINTKFVEPGNIRELINKFE
jgi:hypothetical protein